MKNKFITFLILSVFVLTSPMLAGRLLYGADLHFEHHCLHMHGNVMGDEDPSDANITVHYDCLATITAKTCIVDNHLPNTFLCSKHHNHLNIISSRTEYFLGINRFCLQDVYQLNSSYLI